MLRSSFRFSLASLVVVVAGFGLALAAIKNPTPFMASLVYSLTLLLLAGAVIVAASRPGRARAFGVGFAVFGGSYFIYLFGLADKQTEYVTTPRLFTSIALEALEEATPSHWAKVSVAPGDMTLLVEKPSPEASPAVRSLGPVTHRYRNSPWHLRNSLYYFRLDPWSTYPFNGPDPRHNSMDFHRIGHSLTTLLLAILGGMFALWMVPKPSHDE